MQEAQRDLGRSKELLNNLDGPHHFVNEHLGVLEMVDALLQLVIRTQSPRETLIESQNTALIYGRGTAHRLSPST